MTILLGLLMIRVRTPLGVLAISEFLRLAELGCCIGSTDVAPCTCSGVAKGFTDNIRPESQARHPKNYFSREIC